MVIHLFHLIIIKEKRRVINRLWENIITSAGFVGSRLELIFHWKAQWLINPMSWFNSFGDVMESLTIENSDVSSTKNLIEDFIPFFTVIDIY